MREHDAHEPQGEHDARAEREERYERLVELAPDGMLIHDGQVIVAVNAATMRMAGAISRAQLIGLPIERVLRPPFLRAAEAELTGTNSFLEPAPAVRDIFYRLDGGAIPVEIRAQMFLVREFPSAHLIIRDISERLAAEEAARVVAERLQTTQRLDAVGALAGGVAHEVNNMLQVILGFGSLLLDEPHDTPLDHAARQADVREVLRAATQAAAITRQLLEFSRHGVHCPRAVGLDGVLRDFAPMMRRLLGENRLLDLRIHATPPVWMDVGQLEQVLVNLLLNARHATVDGGTVTVSATPTEITSATLAADGAEVPEALYASLVIRDDGAGMSAATQRRIFEPFFSTKRSDEGTGLGLAAVQGIMAQNGGFILVRSAEGAGTSMTLLWPAMTDTPQERALAETPDEECEDTPLAPRPTPPRGMAALTEMAIASSKRVLVVDDEPSVRAVTRRVLERGGYVVGEAANGADALAAIARDGPPSLVLSDLRMPGMGGIELARRLALQWPRTPVLFMSGYSADAIERTSDPDAVVYHIEKPFGNDVLLAQIVGILATHPVERRLRSRSVGPLAHEDRVIGS
jgi:two-component system, cell cycle sensor histidine kinase and response regulator CckA